MRQWMARGPDGLEIGVPAQPSSAKSGVSLSNLAPHERPSGPPLQLARRDMRPVAYVNMDSAGTPGAPQYRHQTRTDFGQGGYTNLFNYLVGGTGTVDHGAGPFSIGPNDGFGAPGFTRSMLWQPNGDQDNGLGSFNCAQFDAHTGADALEFVWRAIRDAAGFMRTTGGKPNLTIDIHAGLAGDRGDQLEATRLYEPTTDQWYPESIRKWRDHAGVNGTWFLDAGALFYSKAIGLSRQAPVRVGVEAFPELPSGALDMKFLIDMPAWIEWSNFISRPNAFNWLAPPYPYHEMIIIVGAGQGPAVADLRSCLRRGFVLGVAPWHAPSVANVKQAYAEEGKSFATGI